MNPKQHFYHVSTCLKGKARLEGSNPPSLIHGHVHNPLFVKSGTIILEPFIHLYKMKTPPEACLNEWNHGTLSLVLARSCLVRTRSHSHILEAVEPDKLLLIVPLDGGDLIEAVDGNQVVDDMCAQERVDVVRGELPAAGSVLGPVGHMTHQLT